ncbi:subtilase family-domain-containing protein [Chytriomyces cf. hyalinus JEL632]|nr:subtilase family-domain-containing protein [Chytriomyces cf. hyalinus JEL632]
MAADFPTTATLPKEETQSASFIEHFPTFDGRDTVIAILDTGVDPGAIGMQFTTTGENKIIELIDCTGSGDVDMTKSAEATVTTDAEGVEVRTLKGLTGRTLTIPSAWPLPADGKYRLGWKASKGLFPNDLVPRIKDARKRNLEIENHKLITAVQEKLAAHELQHPKLEANDKEMHVRQDLKDRIHVLKEQIKSFEDPGSVWDCVSFHDGVKWRAAIDVNESGDFQGADLLAGFSDELKYSSFGDDSRLNFSINFYDNGDLLSIVTLSGTHGTHVAAIAAANHPTDPRMNGVAPGAKIISLKIGDSRLGSQETPQSLTRAAAELARLKVDIANISYGEPGSTFDYGRCIELLQEEAINKAGCIVVSAAGNAGPILSSIGHPSGNSGLITVGAYMTEAMPNALYALLDTVPERPFSFTSLGPTLDGAVGVDVYAPGGAITSVPQYTRNTVQLMNGTSMASPNAAGCVSLLVSGLKQSKISYNPYRVGTALRNSSKDVKDPFKIGLLQVEKAWEHLSIQSIRHNLDVFYEVAVTGPNRGRGLYLRNPVETSVVQRPSVNVKPLFVRPLDAETTSKMLEFEAHVSLQSTVPWIQCPEFVMIPSKGRDFLINVDPTGLAPGLHVGDILGIDTNLPSAGPLFRIPVTVCKVDNTAVADVALTRFSNMEFTSGEIVRKYISVPSYANFATITVKSKDRVGNAAFWLMMEQIHAQTPYSSFENGMYLQLGSTTSGVEGEEFVKSQSFPVAPGFTAELAMCQYCTALGKTTVSVDVEFHGIQVTASSIAEGSFGTKSSGDLLFLNSANAGLTRIDIHSHLRKENVAAVSVSLDKVQKSLRPTEATISPLKERDLLPDGRQLYQLVLSYTLKVSEEGNVLPFYPRTMATFYDNFFESIWIFVYDSQKSLKSVHDCKTRPAKLKEGTYTIKMQIVSRSLEVLDNLQQTPILVNYDTKPVTLQSYKTLGGLVSGTNKFQATVLARGESATCWLSAVEGTALPKFASPGDLLLGSFKVVDGAAAAKIEAAYLVPSELPKKEDAAPLASTPLTVGAAPETEKDELADAIRDLEISHLKKLSKNVEKRAALIEKLEKEHGAFLPFLVARLGLFAEEFDKAQETDAVKEEHVENVQTALEAILATVNQTDVAAYFGVKVDLAAGGEAAKTKQKDLEAQKAAISQSLLWKARLNSHKLAQNTDTEAAGALESTFDQSLQNLAQWIASPPTSDGKYLTLWVRHLKRKGYDGTALKAINTYLGDAKNVASGDAEKSAIWKELVALKKTILSENVWTVWVGNEVRTALLGAPPAFELF